MSSEEKKKYLENKETKEAYDRWARDLLKRLIEQEEVEDYFYEFRKEAEGEDSYQVIIRSYALWEACRLGISKEEIEKLYKKGYRFFQPMENELEISCYVSDFFWNYKAMSMKKNSILEGIENILMKTIEEDAYPSILFEDYGKSRLIIKPMVIAELFLKMENLGKSEDRDNAQEVFLDKMEKTVPWIYKDLLSVPVSEFAFHSRGQVAYFDSFLKRYIEYQRKLGSEEEILLRIKEWKEGYEENDCRELEGLQEQN